MDKDKRRLVGPAIRALVVDDSTVVRRLMEFTLSAVGIEIDFAATGEDALALVRHGRYDIIFLDVLLPGIDGYRVCKAIRAERLTKDTPVVMLTSKDSAIDKVRGIMAGSSVYLTKPLDRSELMQAIDKCLPLRAMYSAHAERTRGQHA
jgi:twitching motility two-component system response regulator PilG